MAERPDHRPARPGPVRRSCPAVLADGDARQVIVLASVLELPPRQRERAVVATLAGLAPGETVVFVTDDLDFSVFVKRKQLYEYLPPLAHQASCAMPRAWDQYLVARLRILMEKWSPARVVSPGTPLDAFVRKSSAL